MSSPTRPPNLWIRWLLAASAGVILFGLSLVIAPAIARQGFSLLVYSSTSKLDTFSSEAVRYISLAHAVIGAVMIGWGVVLLLITRELLAKGSRVGWKLITISVGSWFIPDTVYSFVSGYWQNAVLNIGFLALFAIPLLGTVHYVRDES